MPGDARAASPAGWQAQLAAAIRDPVELLRRLDLDPDVLLAPAWAASQGFPLLVTEAFLSRMQSGDSSDPLLRQVLPIGAELDQVAGYGHDPLAESTAGCAPGLLQKYQGRALLVLTGACAIHCRYCFRRHFPYHDTDRSGSWWGPALAHLAADPDVRELLLSGGDPLILGNGIWRRFLIDCQAIDHLETIRIHSRLPVVLPDRIDDGLIDLLGSIPQQVVVVIHANHPAEIDADVQAACRRLGDVGITVLNQAVLLAGVNDDGGILEQLSRRLFRAGVLPYYLHQLDQVAGAAHFAVADDDARLLLRSLHARLPGYLVPRLVREIPGRSGKTPLSWAEGA